MWERIWNEFSGRGMGIILGMFLGTLVTACVAWWKRRQERLTVMRGDARDTVVIAQHLIETEELPRPDGKGMMRCAKHMRIRSLGQSQLDRVVPNGHLAAELLHRAYRVTNQHTLISMEGAEGSYLLETLTNFVCDRVGNAPFEHDLYVMVPCCEPGGLVIHQPITILLVRVADLPIFENWNQCRNVQVEHGADGMRVLTLMEIANRFRGEQEELTALRQAGKRTKYLETMYVLDLALDRREADISVKSVPWGRFEGVLQELGLE